MKKSTPTTARAIRAMDGNGGKARKMKSTPTQTRIGHRLEGKMWIPNPWAFSSKSMWMTVDSSTTGRSSHWWTYIRAGSASRQVR